MCIRDSEESYDIAKKYNSVSYLVKPFDILTLKGSIEMAGNIKPDSTILLRHGKNSVLIDLESIFWIEANGNYCIIHANDKKYSVRKSMVKFLNGIQTEKIIKIHRQYAVSVDKISKVHKTKGELVLENGKVLPFGRTFKDNLIHAIKKR